MRYYISVLTTYLTVSQEFNSFLTAFLPMAMESVALFDVLLAFASGHLSLTDESYKVAALETRSTAIRSLATAISTPSDQVACHETNAAACLGLVIYEAGVGDCRAWYTHLKGTQNIIKSTSAHSGGKLLNGPEAFKHSTEGRCILRNYAYHDVIGSITLQKTPLLRGDYLDGIADVVDSCIGVAAGLLCIIARIGFLGEETTIKDQTSDDEVREKLQQLQSASAEIEQELLSWHCHPDASPGLAALAYAYRTAALIVLYRLVRSRIRSSRAAALDFWGPEADTMDAIQTKIQGQVADTLEHVSEIPVGSAPEGALLFPVFIAGGEAIEQDHIDMVRSRLRLMARKRQFRNLSQARDVLEDLWDLRKMRQGVNADWTQILDASGEDLLLT
ncbi:fungal-specific transcription factor domain-containing protein [Ilyonectria destructans]|nr:fungal-specific transcription factor domain-containing protein [Ilyonectria destructans]